MRCPRCMTEELDPAHDDAGMVTCRCGHRAYAGYVAEADSLAARPPGSPTGGCRDPARSRDPARLRDLEPTRGGPPTGGPRRPASRPLPQPPPTRGAPSAQTLLLGVGALLLVIAGAVFAAVVWDRLGSDRPGCADADRHRRRGGPGDPPARPAAGTAEALAVVAAGLAVVDLMAAPRSGCSRRAGSPTPPLPGCRVHRTRWRPAAPAPPRRAAGMELAGVGRAARRQPPAWSPRSPARPTPRRGRRPPSRSPRSPASRCWQPRSAPTVGTAAGRATTVGAFGLFLSAAATASAAWSRALPGALVPTAAIGAGRRRWAAGPSAHRPGTHRCCGAAPLSGITVALVLALPEDPQPVWLAAAVALAGLTMGWSSGSSAPIRCSPSPERAPCGSRGLPPGWTPDGHAHRGPGRQPALPAGPARGRDGLRRRVVAPGRRLDRRPARHRIHAAGPDDVAAPSRPTPWCRRPPAARRPALAPPRPDPVPAVARPSRRDGPDPLSRRHVVSPVGAGHQRPRDHGHLIHSAWSSAPL